MCFEDGERCGEEIRGRKSFYLSLSTFVFLVFSVSILSGDIILRMSSDGGKGKRKQEKEPRKS